MKLKISVILAAATLALTYPQTSFSQLLNKLKNTAKNTAEGRADEGAANATNKAIDKGADAATGNDNDNNSNNSSSSNSNNTTPSSSQPPGIKSYQNYDFVPGDKILFEDHFTDDQDGEFPSHWELLSGQGVLNKMNNTEVFALTDGNYVRVVPRLKTADYLTDPFTVEYDTYFTEGSYGLMVFFKKSGSESNDDGHVYINESEITYDGGDDDFHLGASLPSAIAEDNYKNKWHHIALAYKNKQLKVYVDQFRVLTIPDMHMVPANVHFGGIGSQDAPMIFKDVRIASGGNMNMIGKKFTESKIVTHGINFDVDKATIKPESMGTLNMIVGVMKDNPDIKFEIDGHTDNSGEAAHNLTLSQQRADAVKTQLVSMGIDASRLTTKGFGDTKPISDNSTLEGKANNRRVEFVKM